MSNTDLDELIKSLDKQLLLKLLNALTEEQGVPGKGET